MALAMLGCATVSTSIVIPAPPEDVWAVLTDTEGYRHWNPVLLPLKGKLKVGERLTYRMTAGNGKQSEVGAKVLERVKDKSLRQYGGLWGILTFDHRWSLEAVVGGTRVTQHEDYRGIGVWFWDYSWVEGAYAKANAGLKRRVLELRGGSN